MNKSRIFGGFSLVEMMLLLLIVSLMIASSVAVISKRHIKVPRLAMHGAYMCYYKNGNLHEERYVGSGLTKKVVDQDVAECTFTPPDKISYLHIQATGGGGGGGDSGYRGGDIKTYTSATEVISPFGITEDFLELKGITTAGDPAYANLWGQIHAYANGEGEMGSAGDGGDLWYIKKECGSGCLAEREWKNKDTGEKGCWMHERQISPSESGYQHELRHYNYWRKEDCKAKDEGTPKYREECNADCNAYEYYANNVSEEDEDFDYCVNEDYKTYKCWAGMDWDDCDAEHCTEDYYDCTGKYLGAASCSSHCNEEEVYEQYVVEYCIGEEKTGDCYYCDDYRWDYDKGYYVCTKNYTSWDWVGTGKYESCGYNTGTCKYSDGYYYDRGYKNGRICKKAHMIENRNNGRCGTGSTKWVRRSSQSYPPTASETGMSFTPKDSCTNRYNEPFDATACTFQSYKTFNLDVKDTFQEDTNVGGDNNKYPGYMRITQAPNAGYISARATKPLVERKISRPTAGESYTICNYGNTTLYPSVDGIFGSFIIGYDGVNVDCTADGLSAAFGEGIYVISNGTTTNIPTFQKDIPSSQHYNPLIEYDVSEDYEDQQPYGDVEVSSIANGSWVSEADVAYKNPFTHVTYKPQMSLPRSCNIVNDSWKNHVVTTNTSDCDPILNYTGYGNVSGNKKIFDSWIIHPRTNEYKTVRDFSKCVDVQSSWETYNPSLGGSEINADTGKPNNYGSATKTCMLKFDDYTPKNETDSTMIDKNNGDYTRDNCAYVPEMVEGGIGGQGVSCTLPAVTGGVNVQYRGYGGILPGIRGSNFIAIPDYNNRVKALYTEAEYNAQSSGYAENGTDSLGYAKISLGVGDNVDSLPTCILHNEATNAFPTKGTGARKTSTGATTPQAGTNGVNGRAEFSNGGYNAGLSLGSNQVGYRIDGKANPENYKYQYYYTWDTNFMQYGEGGEAGEYIVKVVRAIKDKELRITVGRGGAGGTPESGEDGQNGGDTVIEDVLIAKGGKGGLGGQTTPVEQLPYWQGDGAEGWDYTRGKVGTPGGKHEGENVKSNIMNLILPVDNNFTLQKWVMASGEGGNGGGSQNNCWASEWVRYFENEEDPKSIRAEDVACRQGKYWSAEPNAEAGIDGLVLIRW